MKHGAASADELHPMQRVSPCPFCELDDPAVTVYSDDVLQALVSRAPINRYHVIIGQGYNLVAQWKLHLIPRFGHEAVRIDWARTADPGPHERGRIADDIRRHLSPAST